MPDQGPNPVDRNTALWIAIPGLIIVIYIAVSVLFTVLGIDQPSELLTAALDSFSEWRSNL